MNARGVFWTLLLGLLVACLGSGCGAEDPPPCPAPDAGRTEVDPGAACEMPAPPDTFEVVPCAADPALAACVLRTDGHPLYISGCGALGFRCVDRCPFLDGGAL